MSNSSLNKSLNKYVKVMGVNMNKINSCYFKNFRVNYTNQLNIKMAFIGVEFCKLAYFDNPIIVEKNLENTNFKLIDFKSIQDTNLVVAHYTQDTDFLVFCFSGTRDYSIKNIKINWDLRLEKFILGRVHSGFLKLFRDFEKIIVKHIKNHKNILWSGHSRGGALSGLAQSFYECGVNYSFGCPRFGDAEYAKNNPLPHYRFTFDNDPIQYLPPKFLSYKHHGKRIKLQEDEIFNDIDSNETNVFQVNELTRDWHLIKYAVKDWLSGKNSGRHHYKETYSKCFEDLKIK